MTNESPRLLGLSQWLGAAALVAAGVGLFGLGLTILVYIANFLLGYDFSASEGAWLWAVDGAGFALLVSAPLVGVISGLLALVLYRLDRIGRATPVVAALIGAAGGAILSFISAALAVWSIPAGAIVGLVLPVVARRLAAPGPSDV